MVTTTSIVLGTRDTPGFVSYEFFDAVKFLAAINAVDVTFSPNKIRYYVPPYSVIERSQHPYQEYIIDLDDAHLIPTCTRRNKIGREVWKHKTPNSVFDRMTICTYEWQPHYFLLLPKATYYHTCIFTDQSTSHIVFSGIEFQIRFSRVYVDPHDTAHSVWFSGTPKYRIEITCNQDFRQNMTFLRRAIASMLPRAFKLDTLFGNP